MNKKDALVEDLIKEDLREVLIQFWLSTMRDAEAQYPEKMKAAECLAKYVLSEGSTKVNKPTLKKVSTTDLLKMVEEFERQEDEE